MNSKCNKENIAFRLIQNKFDWFIIHILLAINTQF